MKARILVLTLMTLLVYNLTTIGQTTEFQYFYHPEYFNDSTIKEKRIKKISVTSFLTRPNGKIYQDSKNVYIFNELGDLLCSESYSFNENDSQVITKQTIDCHEYRNGLQTRHLRYHNKKDSAEWVEEFSYVHDRNGNITKIIVKDLSYPHNSKTIEKIYDSKNRILIEKTDFGYLTEYRYDSKDNIIERVWGPKEGPRNKNLYSYDEADNLIKYEFKGTSFDNYNTVKEINKYDSQGRIILKESISAENIKSQIRYSYEGKNTIITKLINQKGEVQSTTTKNFANGLIQSEMTVRDGVIHFKEVYDYEFNKN
ncbi:hypothetical protein [Peijinzhouia sedimentorum]